MILGRESLCDFTPFANLTRVLFLDWTGFNDHRRMKSEREEFRDSGFTVDFDWTDIRVCLICSGGEGRRSISFKVIQRVRIHFDETRMLKNKKTFIDLNQGSKENWAHKYVGSCSGESGRHIQVLRRTWITKERIRVLQELHWSGGAPLRNTSSSSSISSFGLSKRILVGCFVSIPGE